MKSAVELPPQCQECPLIPALVDELAGQLDQLNLDRDQVDQDYHEGVALDSSRLKLLQENESQIRLAVANVDIKVGNLAVKHNCQGPKARQCPMTDFLKGSTKNGD